MRNGFAALMVVAFGVLGAGAVRAQEPVPVPRTALRVDFLPPLPDSLRLYGDTLAVRFIRPDADPPGSARRVSLAEAIRLALAQSPDLRIDVLEAERAANDVTPGNAGYRPTLDASGSLSGSGTQGLFDLGADSTGSDGGTGGSTALSAGVTLGYTVFDATRAATYRRLQLEAERFALTAEARAEALAYAVTAAYLDVLRQRQLLEALDEAVGVSEDRLRIAQARVGIGVGAEVDAALALSDLNADRAALLRQQLALVQARATLGALLALDDPEAVEATDSLRLGAAPALDRLAAEAVVGNRGLQALEVAQAVAETAVDEIRGEYLPTVRAQAGTGFSTFDQGLFPAFEPIGGLDVRYGLTLSLPLFDGGERRRRAENARIRVRQADLDTEAETVALRAAAARLVAAVERYRQLAALETQNRQIARQNVRVALAQLELGLLSALDLRQVQVAFLNAESRLVDTVYQARRAEAELRLLAGDLLPGDRFPLSEGAAGE